MPYEFILRLYYIGYLFANMCLVFFYAYHDLNVWLIKCDG